MELLKVGELMETGSWSWLEYVAEGPKPLPCCWSQKNPGRVGKWNKTNESLHANPNTRTATTHAPLSLRDRIIGMA